jgi:hypothetical protein
VRPGSKMTLDRPCRSGASWLILYHGIPSCQKSGSGWRRLDHLFRHPYGTVVFKIDMWVQVLPLLRGPSRPTSGWSVETGPLRARHRSNRATIPDLPGRSPA